MPDPAGFLLTRSVAVLLHVFGYRRTASLLAFAARRGRRPARVVDEKRRAEAVARRVEAAALAARFRSAASARAGRPNDSSPRRIDATVRIGVRCQGGTLKAHAWVEHERAPVLEPEEVVAGFAAFDHELRVSAIRGAAAIGGSTGVVVAADSRPRRA
jgi:hypothetical protein